FADGLCCTLSTPCLSGGTSAEQQPATARPVVMRRNFNWKDVDSRSLREVGDIGDVGDVGGVGTSMSYGVRNSLAAYLSLSGALDDGGQKTDSRKKKCKSLFALSLNNDDVDP
ncbi:hypothetical protein CRUP_021277, partial [Coryphaenoides rupestris]